jgi:hypothetical protein
VEAADGGGSLAGAGVWPAGELQGPDCFVFFCFGLDCVFFSVQGHDCFYNFCFKT